MNELKDKHNSIIKELDNTKANIQSLLNDINKKENDYNVKFKQLNESYEKRSKELEESYSKLVEELKTSTADTLKEHEESYSKMYKALADEKQHWEIEKETIAATRTFESLVNLNVGGSKFSTTLTTLTRLPDTMLGAMFSGRHKLITDEAGYYFIDRDGTHFRHILNYLRCPEDFDANCISAEHVKELKKEASYYGLGLLMMFEIDTKDDRGNEVKLKNIDGIWHSTYWQGRDKPFDCQPIYYCNKCNTGRRNKYVTNLKLQNFSNLVSVIDPNQPKFCPTCR